MTTTRRDVLHQCLALGGVSVAAGFSSTGVIEAWAEQGTPRKATPVNEIGPFYKKRAPDSRVLRLPGDPGLPLSVSGKVWSARGEALPGAVIEVWQADHVGHYDLEGYRYRARVPADGEARYSLETDDAGPLPRRASASTSTTWSPRRATSRSSRSSTSPPTPPSKATPTATSRAIR